MRGERQEKRERETRNKRGEKSKEKIDIINGDEIENKGIKYFIKRREK